MARLLPCILPDRLLRPMLASAYGDPAVLTVDVSARHRDMPLAPPASAGPFWRA